MEQNIDIKLTVEGWAKILIDRWIMKIDQLKIASWSGNGKFLRDSFMHEVISSAGGDVARIEFAFNWYGRMVELGVGKGVSLADIGRVQTKRKAKKWYTKTFYSEFHKLVYILKEKYGMNSKITIWENVDDNASSAKTGSLVKTI